MGKGSRPRPISVPREEYERRWRLAFHERKVDQETHEMLKKMRRGLDLHEPKDN
jgi:hypothetical protein